jgi:uncharacterized protein (DUF885 family)
MNPQHSSIAIANRLVSDAWELQRQTPFVQLQIEGVLQRMPDLSRDAVIANSQRAQSIAERIDILDAEPLPEPIAIPLRQARYAMEIRRHAGEWYDVVIDPSGLAFYGLFAATPYCGGFLLNTVFEGLAKHSLNRPGDFDRYLAAVTDLETLFDQMAERTLTQAAAGIRMPRPQIPAAHSLISATKARVSSLGMACDVAFRGDVKRRVARFVLPALDRFAAIFDESYERKAPQEVGIGQFEGGAEIYRQLVRLHTTLDLTAEEVHEEGLRRMGNIEARMRDLRSRVGLVDDPGAYLARAFADPRFSAPSSEGVEAIFCRYIERMRPALLRAFHAPPHADYKAVPLPDAMQAGMTFGMYSPPRPGQPAGRFMFNPAHLTKVPLINIAALTYHELVPGHHLHLCAQQESEVLLPISRHSFCNAFNEGWAEYAATLAGELGMYEEPEEEYGRCMMDAFLTSRLVVDTGMNVLGWSLQRARDYLRQHSYMSDAEIASETLRYSCDIPGQAVAYKLCDSELMRARETSKQKLGHDFDLREFHANVLRYGSVPLPDLIPSLIR